MHYYSPVGCCVRDFYLVFLQLDQGAKFSEAYPFMNPTFSPAEKLIRGFGYGYPEEGLELYKYEWKGLQVDTVEHIYHLVGQPGKYLRRKGNLYSNDKKTDLTLSAVPPEYHTINRYDWFAP